MFPDYSVETKKFCKSFDSVKAALRSKGVRNSVLFPAKLCCCGLVVFSGSARLMLAGEFVPLNSLFTMDGCSDALFHYAEC